MVAPDKKKRLINEAYSKLEALIEQTRREAAETCANLVKQVEESHRQERVELHNRLGAIIEEMKPAPENAVLVLELLKHEITEAIISRMAEAPKVAPPPEEIPPTKE